MPDLISFRAGQVKVGVLLLCWYLGESANSSSSNDDGALEKCKYIWQWLRSASVSASRSTIIWSTQLRSLGDWVPKSNNICHNYTSTQLCFCLFICTLAHTSCKLQEMSADQVWIRDLELGRSPLANSTFLATFLRMQIFSHLHIASQGTSAPFTR